MMSTLAVESENRVIGGADEEQLLNMFFVLFKTAQIMEPNNPTFINQTQNFYDRLFAISDGGKDVTIKMVAGHYFINNKMVRFKDQGLFGAASIVRGWKKLCYTGLK